MSDKRVTVWVQRFKDRPHLVLQWIDPDTGRRKSQSAKTADPEQAKHARGDLEADLNNGRYAEASRMTWERFRELFEEEYVAGLRPDTREVHANTLNLFEKVCNPKALRSITARTISAFVARLRKLPGRGGKGTMMASTIYVRLEFLHTAMQWAKDQGLIHEMPKFPDVDVPEKDPAPVPSESFERILGKADPAMRAFLLCGWLAGLRRKEATALEWEETDVAPWADFARNRIWLPADFVKAKKDQWVPLDPELREALLALPRRSRKVFAFVGPRGNPLRPTSVSDRVAQLAKKAGVKLSMKSLRRGFGCRYAGKVPAQVLQKLMRHSNIAITMKYYANVDEAVEAAVLGEQRNTKRNNPQESQMAGAEVTDVNCNDATRSAR